MPWLDEDLLNSDNKLIMDEQCAAGFVQNGKHRNTRKMLFDQGKF
jgi:hypothetical protein